MVSSRDSRVFNLLSTSKKPPELVNSSFYICKIFGVIFLHPILRVRWYSIYFRQSTEEKQALIKGATQLLVDVLNKNPATTVVVIDEVNTDNWGIGGEVVSDLRKKKA